MLDFVREFEEIGIFRQGLLESFEFGTPKISLHFGFPKRFDIQFIRVEDYRVTLPLLFNNSVREWSATRNSELLSGLAEKRRRLAVSPCPDESQLCHFHMTFGEGYLDVIAPEFVFMMVSR